MLLSFNVIFLTSFRFLGFDILTIREAAWLTDNSYSYHDVVKMMGELVAALRGNIRVSESPDILFLNAFLSGVSFMTNALLHEFLEVR